MSGPTSTDLPTGTITFLLTDIERSTALWEAHGEDMARAVERHEEIIKSATEARGGIVVRSKGEGDSCFCVFTTASGALAAALQAQLELVSKSWPGPQIAVRMALHTGAAELREGQYYGTVINRCARLRGIGHGGQTLLSSTTQGLVRESVPSPVTLKDLGAHRLPDLAQPERVYQLCHPELPAKFPALASLDAYPNNLPMQLTRFVGRERELADLTELLATNRLVTITGPGGCGKTRLSLQIGADILGDFPDGVWLVNLAAISDGALVAAEVASSLGLREEPNRALLDTIVDYLRVRRVLLLLDNCEHVLRAAAELVVPLLALCRNLRIIATSRQALTIEGEMARLLDPLSVPADNKLSVDELLSYEGVQLLSDRAALARTGFTVTEQNADAVATICRRLDGIPLAIELAAARLGSLGPGELARRLDDRFRLLAGGRRGGPPRHQTLDAAVDWSYELCDDDERLLFRRLAVFVGGFTLEAVENICEYEGLEPGDVAGLLSRLVDRSLVYADTDEAAVTYRMLQTIRSFALARLEGSGEGISLQSRHLDWFLSLAVQADEHLLGAGRERWVTALDAHHDDIRAALSWALSADPVRALRLAGALGSFWDRRGHWTEGRRWLEAALAVAPDGDPHLPRALGRAGNLAFQQGDYEVARGLLARSLALSRESGDDEGAAMALSRSADLEIAAGDLAAGREAFDEALEIGGPLGDRRPAGLVINLALAAQALGHPLVQDLYRDALALSRYQRNTGGIAAALVGLGTLAQARGDLREARTMHEDALVLFRELNDRYGIATTLTSLASIVRADGDRAAAAELLSEALPIHRELGDRRGASRALVRLGLDALSRGELDAASTALHEALGVSRELEDVPGIVGTLTYLARVASRNGDRAKSAAMLTEALDWCRRNPFHRSTATCLEEVAGRVSGNSPDRAARLFGAAEAIRESVGAREPRSDQAAYDRSVSSLRGSLGEDGFATSWDEGRAMSPEEAIAFAREGSLGR